MKIFLATWPVADQKTPLDYIKREKDHRLLSFHFLKSMGSDLYFNESPPDAVSKSGGVRFK